jgi:hypothetical protein
MRRTAQPRSRRARATRGLRALWPPLLIAVCAAATAEPAPTPSACDPDQLQDRIARLDARQRPDAAAGPTDVALGVLLIDLLAIDEVDQRFDADLRIEYRWRDPRLAPGSLGCESAGARIPPEWVWHPDTLLLNAIDAEESLDPAVAIGRDGDLRLVQRFTGSFSSRMQLEDFPLEIQPLAVVLGTRLLGPEQVRVRTDPELGGLLGATTVAGWSLGPPSTAVDTVSIADLTVHRVRYEFPAQRRPGFFAYKVVLPLALIVAMSWSVFWLDPRYVDAQLGVASATILTLIAFQLGLSELLPRIPYLTRMDHFVLGSTVLVFAALAEALWTSSLSARDRLPTARRIDRISRFVFPVAYAAFGVACAL